MVACRLGWYGIALSWSLLHGYLQASHLRFFLQPVMPRPNKGLFLPGGIAIFRVFLLGINPEEVYWRFSLIILGFRRSLRSLGLGNGWLGVWLRRHH